MKLIERIKLQRRANKYKNKDDIGGIAYVNSSIKTGQTVLDIGAHKAGYLYFIRKQVGSGGSVFAFEPQSNLYQYIIKIKRLFNWENVTVEHLALSETVSTETLDSYCSRKAIKPDFLKIDVEGNELNVFKGGIETLKKNKPKIIVEIEARHVGQALVLETFQFLESLQYKGHFIQRQNRIPLSSFNLDIHQNINDKANYCNNFTFE